MKDRLEQNALCEVIVVFTMSTRQIGGITVIYHSDRTVN